MKRHGAALAALALAVPALLLATRLPAEGSAPAFALALAGATAAFGVLAAARPRTGWAPPAALAAAIGLIAVPASPEAFLPLPSPVVAVAALALFHWLYPLDAAEAPRVGRHQGSLAHAVGRLLPMAAVLGLLAATPFLAGALLPDRLASARELRGPLVAIVAALAVAAVLVAVLATRAALARARRRRSDAAGLPSALEEGA